MMRRCPAAAMRMRRSVLALRRGGRALNSRLARHRLLRDRSGATALEFALLGSALMLLSLGILEYGRLSWTREALQAVAINGARCMGVQAASCASAGVYSASTTMAFLTQQASVWDITLTNNSYVLNRSASCGGISGFSQVTISYTFTTLVPLLLTSMGAGVPLTVQACFPNQS